MNLDIDSIAEHVNDAPSFHFFDKHIELPFWITKYGVIELIVALMMVVLFLTFAQKIKGGKQPKGRLWNFLEVFLLYIRDNVVRPSIGHKEVADRYFPYICTLFFFVLGCNLLGLVPFLGSPTGSFSVTIVLALFTFLIGVCSGMKKYGAAGYWLGQVPNVEMPKAMAFVVKPMLFVIEVFGLLVKHSVLAIRLLANMFAGHTVVAVIMAFISGTAAFGAVWYPVAAGSIGFSICMNMLELLVAFIQAYIISFLSALYIGMAIHQH
ncbi:MAG: F0F1 ATP synthase subunit A [Planctomycetaceae bacterium]|jgi:F-type H+-transporting ATPase subunit a|nr:F0F1 ATP synthase subunit A [Planctomycetaceae bacterium]